jgi:ABC-type phosphate transport system substrate-binding protein
MLRLMTVMRIWLLPWLVLLAVCGCSNGTAASARQTGTIDGDFLRVGGPAPGAPVPLAGRVSLTAVGRDAVTVMVGANGKFSVTLPIGNYKLLGTSPAIGGGNGPCSRTVSVTVRPHERVHVQAICDVK